MFDFSIEYQRITVVLYRTPEECFIKAQGFTLGQNGKIKNTLKEYFNSEALLQSAIRIGLYFPGFHPGLL